MSGAGDEMAFTAVVAFLEGPEASLRPLATLFNYGDVLVRERNPDEWTLTSPALDQAWDDPSALRDTGTRILRLLNGIARVEHPGHRPVTLAKRFEGPGKTVLASADDLGVVETALIAMPMVEPPPGPGRDYLAKAGQNDQLSEALRFLGTPTSELGWFDLWKVFELVRGHPPKMESVTEPGWMTEDQYRSFRRSANDSEISGDAARHAGGDHGDADPMSLGEAQSLISGLVQRWVVSLRS